MTSKAQKNYRDAARMRSEREREERELRMQALETKAREASYRASQANTRYENVMRNVQELPAEFLAQIVGACVREAVDAMVDRHVVDEIVEEVMRGIIIRTPTAPYRTAVGPQIFVDNEVFDDRDTHITITIPELKVTRVLPDYLVQSITGGRGPVVQPNADIYIHAEPRLAAFVDVHTSPDAQEEIKTVII